LQGASGVARSPHERSDMRDIVGEANLGYRVAHSRYALRYTPIVGGVVGGPPLEETYCPSQ